MRVTSPCGVATAGDTGVTVTSNVTGCARIDGFAEETRAVAVDALFTTCEMPPSLASKLTLPA